MRMFMKLLTALIAVSLFIIVVKDKTLTTKQQLLFIIVWLMFLMCSWII